MTVELVENQGWCFWMLLVATRDLQLKSIQDMLKSLASHQSLPPVTKTHRQKLKNSGLNSFLYHFLLKCGLSVNWEWDCFDNRVKCIHGLSSSVNTNNQTSNEQFGTRLQQTMWDSTNALMLMKTSKYKPTIPLFYHSPGCGRLSLWEACHEHSHQPRAAAHRLMWLDVCSTWRSKQC